MGQDDRIFHAYQLHDQGDMPLVTAPVARDWMDDTTDRFAYRCLPLAIANQAGWLILNPVTFSACWDGGPFREGVTITFPSGEDDPRVTSHFGVGTITFAVPYLFRTPEGVNLWVKGPSNWIKDGVQPLEGIVETDWLPATFTMNWKLTRTHNPVRFDRGDPICMVVPVARGLAEGLEPCLSRLEQTPTLAEQYLRWRGDRDGFLEGLKRREPEAVARGWQRDYMKGLLPNGSRAPEHQTRVHLREFAAAMTGSSLEPTKAT
jgi:hypothetical protein